MIEFSVVIATYNAVKTLNRCLRSVVNQKTGNVEIIVIDGNSKDGTVDIIKQYSSALDYWTSETDHGVYDAWNKALGHCHGEWIMFLGADDYYVDGIFNKYHDFLAGRDITDIDIVSAKCQLINSNEIPLRVFGAPYVWNEFRNRNRLSHGSALHRRRLFDELGNFNIEFNINADYEFLLRRKLRALFFDEILIYMQDGGMSYSAAGLFQTYRVKRYRKSSCLPLDLYYLLKGLTGFYLRKAIWSITKK